MIELSSKESIQKYIARQTDNFNFVDKIASFVNNREFGLGYYRNISTDGSDISFGESSRSGYIWEALSAIGNDLGDVLYENVVDYIDNVSNVDTCKVKALRSMMQMLDVNYELPKKLEPYPIEIQNLVDIFSVQERYFLDSKFIKNEVLEYLESNGIISSMNTYPVGITSEMSSTVRSSLDNYSFDSTQLDNFILDTYKSLISDYLNQEYYNDETGSLLIRSNIGLLNERGYFFDKNSTYSAWEDPVYLNKRSLNIQNGFNPDEIIKNINLGNDSLDNYTGYELNILKEELNKRSERYKGHGLSTRYYQYKEDRFFEYANFVDTTYSNQIDPEIYQFDTNYIIQNQNPKNVIHGDGSVDSEMIDYVADVLLKITKYIRKIRQSIRLQAKKVYMKGTNDLLAYTINEFLIDYVTHFISQHMSTPEISAIVESMRDDLSSHSPGDVKILEYFDETEYFNLHTDTTKYSINKNTNQRFFDQFFKFDSGTGHVRKNSVSPLEFTNDDITSFYLNTLNLKQDLEPRISNLTGDSNLTAQFYDFLSVIFDIGANDSYVFLDGNGNETFGTKLINGNITGLRHNDYLSSVALSNYFQGEIDKCGYTPSSDVDINTQEMTLYKNLDEHYEKEFLESVNDTFDKYNSRVVNISSDVYNLRDELEFYLSSTYNYYFCQSEYDICWNGDNYRYDYFFGNPIYDTDYFIERLNSLDEYVNDIRTEHIINHPVYDTLDLTKQNYELRSNDLYQKITQNIVQIGYNDLKLEDLGEQMEDEKEFIQKRIQNRFSYLQTSLQDFKTQTYNLKNSLDQLNTNLNSIIANLPNTTQDYYFVPNYSKTGQWKCSEGGFPAGADSDKVQYLHDKFSGRYFKTADGKGNFDKKTFSAIGEINPDDYIYARSEQALKIASVDIFRGLDVLSTVETSKSSIIALQGSINKLASTFITIVIQIKDLYQLDEQHNQELLEYLPGGQHSGDVIELKIEFLTEFLSKNITENEFNRDITLSTLNNYMVELTNISVDYTKDLALYTNMWSDLANFFVDFKSPIGNNYKYVPINIDAAYNFSLLLDQNNKKKIIADINEFRRKYQDIDDAFRSLCDEEIMLMNQNFKMITFEYTGDTVENMIADFFNKLIDDVQNKIQYGTIQKDEKLQIFVQTFEESYVDLTRKYLYSEYDNTNRKAEKNQWNFFNTDLRNGVFNLQIEDFMHVLTRLYDELNYIDTNEFKQAEQLFRNYSGLPDYAYDPYYNHKNMVHPSYQIHPFLWNFTSTKIQSSLEFIQKTIGQIAYDDLIDMAIINKIDGYFGKFGNVINIWKNNTFDQSGYITRYEINSHIHNDTKVFGEVVDYDGVFYPPAVDYFRNYPSACIEILSSNGKINISKSQHLSAIPNLSEFYPRFYSHLEMNDICAKDAANRLSVAQDRIMEVTSPHKKADVYDIFKYRMDENNNIYTLYKQYHSETPTSEETRNTVGELWIRLNDHPFAIPMEHLLDFEKSYKPGSEDYKFSELSSMKIIDFEISDSGNIITLIFKNSLDLGKPYIAIHSLTLYIKYDINKDGYKQLSFAPKPHENITEGNQSTVFPSKEKMSQNDWYWSYIGTYKTNSNDTNVLYIKREIGNGDRDGDFHENELSTGGQYNYSIDYRTYRVDYNTVNPTITNNDVKLERETSNNCVQFTYYVDDKDGKCLDFAFLTYNDTMYENVKLTDASLTEKIGDRLSIDFDQNSIGKIIEDPTGQEMNSHDMFNQTVTIVTVNTNNGAKSGSTDFNINSDIGYIPSYPGLEKTKNLEIRTPISEKYQSIELLGRSKNMDYVLSSINKDADPYIDQDYIYDNCIYGRVYEDFDNQFDKTLIIQKNPPMFQNMDSNGIRYGNNRTSYLSSSSEFRWTYEIPSYVGTDEISDYKILLYNTKNLGKNPLLVADLSTIMKVHEYELSDYNKETSISSSEIDITYGNEVYLASGTTNGINEQTKESNNHIENIRRMSVRFDNRKIVIKFFLENKSKNIFIERDDLRLVLLNPYNLEMFNFYHFIDHYNFIRNRYYIGERTCDYKEGWIENFTKNNAFYSEKEFAFDENWKIKLPIQTGNDTYTKQCVFKTSDNSLKFYIENNSVWLNVKETRIYPMKFKIEPNTKYWFMVECSYGRMKISYNTDHGQYKDITLNNNSRFNFDSNATIIFGSDPSSASGDQFVGKIEITNTELIWEKNNNISEYDIELNKYDFYHYLKYGDNWGPDTPIPTVKIRDKILEKDIDYIVSYSNNSGIITGDTTQIATCTVTGIGNYVGTKSKTFNIRLEEQMFNVRITSNDEQMGTVSQSGTNPYRYMSECQIQATNKEGHHFVNWSDGNTENPRNLIVENDISLTGNFEINSYYITVEPNNTEYGLTTGSGNHKHGSKVTITATPKSSDYIFTRWKDGNTDTSREITITGPATYIAIFALNKFTVTYNANGATSGTAPASQTKTYDQILTLRTNTGSLAKTGYTFNGWNTKADGSGTHYNAGGTYNENSNVILYAEWKYQPSWHTVDSGSLYLRETKQSKSASSPGASKMRVTLKMTQTHDDYTYALWSFSDGTGGVVELVPPYRSSHTVTHTENGSSISFSNWVDNNYGSAVITNWSIEAYY